MSRRAALGLATAAALAGCAQTPERIILLPGPDGRTGALVVKNNQGAPREVVLNKPYAQAEAAGGELRPGQSNAETVQRAYAPLLAMQPPRPRSFTVNFRTNSDGLTPETAPVLAEVRNVLAGQPVGELIVIGHTDRVGSDEANDRLSLARAQTVRELLVAMGVPRSQVSVVGRGEREPLIPTADEVAEPRNRRVEIKLR